jgi:hypothetical protein
MGLLLKVVVASYALALVVLPFGHHDLVCHLKSSTHCTTCLVGTSADDHGTQPALAPVSMDDAGQAIVSSRTLTVSRVPSPSSGRSPPVPTHSLV